MNDFSTQLPEQENDPENQIDLNSDFGNKVSEQAKKSSKSFFKQSREKQILWVVSVLGVFSLSFGALRWFTSLQIPFAVNDLGKTVDKTQVLSDNNNLADTLKLQTQDTDGDGLTDYDELNVYNTSPYLEDTDSDSFLDGIEVKNSTDPNCPSGAVCNATASTETVSLPASATNLTPAEIRQLLVQSGLTQAQIDAVDDATLQQMYNDVLKEKSAAIAGTTVNNATDANSAAIDQTANMSAAEIRKLLKDQGATDEELKNVSDEELLKGWQEILAQTPTN